MQVSETVSSLQSPVSSNRSRLSVAEHFRRAVTELLVTRDWRLETPLAIALSGGADSMALTLLANDYARARGGRIVALTVDHGLRLESHQEAAQVANWMRARGIDHHILTPEHRKVSNNLQEAARIWRYDALAEFCSNHGIVHCLLAHHAGDNRETLLLHQSRGITADGEAGMARTRNYRGVRFARPLLELERAELENYLRAQQVSWMEDPSNRNTNFARVRQRIRLQDDSATAANLDAALRANAAARAARDEALAEAAIRCVRIDPLGYAEVALAVLLEHEDRLQSQLLADVLTTIGGRSYRPRAHETARLVQALPHPMKRRTLAHCEVTMKDSSLRIAREFARAEDPIELAGTGNTIWDNRFHIRHQITDGRTYTLRALGHAGRKQLHHSLLTTHHSPLPLATPSLWHLDELVHVPYITKAPDGIELGLGFAPAKPLAPAPFW